MAVAKLCDGTVVVVGVVSGVCFEATPAQREAAGRNNTSFDVTITPKTNAK